MPYPRWGLLDEFYDQKDTICSAVRLRLGTLAEMIPVIYDETNHDRILFRIGDRLYYCKSNYSSALNDDDDFDEHPYSEILGILPVSYSQFLSLGAEAIAGPISDYWTQRNVDASDVTDTDRHALDRVWMYTTVKDTLIRDCGKYPGDEVLKTWTRDEWRAMRRYSAGQRGGYIPSSCQIGSVPKAESPAPTLSGIKTRWIPGTRDE